MARKFPDRVHVTCATTGTGTLTLGSAFASDKRVMPSAIDGHTVDYTITDGTAWEVGYGVYTHSGTTLTRNLIASSTGSLLSLSGSAVVFTTISSATMEAAMAGIDTIVAPTAFPLTISVDITDIPNTYRQLQLVLTAMKHGGGGARTLGVQVSNNNGSSFATSGYVTHAHDIDSGGAVAGAYVQDSLSRSLDSVAASGSNDLDDRVVMIGSYQGGAHTTADTIGVITTAGSLKSAYSARGAYTANTSRVDALRVLWSGIGGTLSGATYALYGIR